MIRVDKRFKIPAAEQNHRRREHESNEEEGTNVVVKTETPTQCKRLWATVSLFVDCWYVALLNEEAEREMGLTTRFIDEQSMPMRYCEFVVGNGVIFG